MKGIAIIGDRTQLLVKNIKCGGCANTIGKSLNKLGFKNVAVNPEDGSVTMDSPGRPQTIDGAVQKLKLLGYPLIDTEEGLNAAASKAMSYLSCAIGKIS